MSKWMSTLALTGLVAAGLPACATKGFVRNRVGEVNGKVDNLTQSVEETQERTRKNEGAINKLKADPNGAFIEIEGHTDNVGGKIINEKVGMERAEAVKRYLFEQHQIPLHKIN